MSTYKKRMISASVFILALITIIILVAVKQDIPKLGYTVGPLVVLFINVFSESFR